MTNVYLESIILIAKISYSVRYYILRYDHRPFYIHPKQWKYC